MLNHIDRKQNYNNPVHFRGIENYDIVRSNLYNGIIQTVLKSGNQRILGFIDAREATHPAQAFFIGNWTLSDILLRDNDTVFAVKVDDNKIYQSSISMDQSKLNWEEIQYNETDVVETIEINENYIQGSYNGNFFKLPLLLSIKSNEQNSTKVELEKVVSVEANSQSLLNDMLIIIICVAIILTVIYFVHLCRKYITKDNNITEGISNTNTPVNSNLANEYAIELAELMTNHEELSNLPSDIKRVS